MKKTGQKTFNVTEVAGLAGMDPSAIIIFIQRKWISPRSEDLLDQEDLARIQLIDELRNRFGVNDEAIPVILHLVDQLYFLRGVVRKSL